MMLLSHKCKIFIFGVVAIIYFSILDISSVCIRYIRLSSKEIVFTIFEANIGDKHKFTPIDLKRNLKKVLCYQVKICLSSLKDTYSSQIVSFYLIFSENLNTPHVAK